MRILDLYRVEWSGLTSFDIVDAIKTQIRQFTYVEGRCQSRERFGGQSQYGSCSL